MDGQGFTVTEFLTEVRADGDRLRPGANPTRRKHRGTGRVDALLPDAQGLLSEQRTHP